MKKLQTGHMEGKTPHPNADYKLAMSIQCTSLAEKIGYALQKTLSDKYNAVKQQHDSLGDDTFLLGIDRQWCPKFHMEFSLLQLTVRCHQQIRLVSVVLVLDRPGGLAVPLWKMKMKVQVLPLLNQLQPYRRRPVSVVS